MEKFEPLSQNDIMQNIETEISEINREIMEIEELVGRLPSGYQFRPMGQPEMLLSDKLNVFIGRTNLKVTKANLEVTKSTLEASQKLIQSIKQFDKSSTRLSRWMLALTMIIALLTVVMVFLIIVQITKSLV